MTRRQSCRGVDGGHLACVIALTSNFTCFCNNDRHYKAFPECKATVKGYATDLAKCFRHLLFPIGKTQRLWGSTRGSRTLRSDHSVTRDRSFSTTACSQMSSPPRANSV